MAKSVGRPPGRRVGVPDGGALKKPLKKPTNLTLDSKAVSRGERFGRRYGRSLSQLVTDFLNSLPAEDIDGTSVQLTPPVRRLYGLAAGARIGRDDYRDHLVRKYRAR